MVVKVKLQGRRGGAISVVADNGDQATITVNVEGVIRVLSYHLNLFNGNQLPPAFAHCFESMEMAIERVVGQDVDVGDLVEISLYNESDATQQVRVEVEIPQYAEPAIKTVELPPFRKEIVGLTPAFNDSIFSVNEQKPWHIHIKISKLDGNLIFEKTEEILILSRNDMMWTCDELGGEWLILAPLIAVFVTPRDKKGLVQDLVNKAAQFAPNTGMIGYQRKQKKVWDLWPLLWHWEWMEEKEIVAEQAGAIYKALTSMGVKYVNTPVSFGEGIQRVKFPAETLEDRSGNCIDLSVLFASAFELLDMRPAILIIPGHAFVGVYSWKDSKEIIPIEATMIGKSTFREAWDFACKEWNDHRNELLIIDIKKCRQYGITPAPNAAPPLILR